MSGTRRGKKGGGGRKIWSKSDRFEFKIVRSAHEEFQQEWYRGATLQGGGADIGGD